MQPFAAAGNVNHCEIPFIPYLCDLARKISVKKATTKKTTTTHDS